MSRKSLQFVIAKLCFYERYARRLILLFILLFHGNLVCVVAICIRTRYLHTFLLYIYGHARCTAAHYLRITLLLVPAHKLSCIVRFRIRNLFA